MADTKRNESNNFSMLTISEKAQAELARIMSEGRGRDKFLVIYFQSGG